MIARLLVVLARFLVGGHPRWRGIGPEARQRIYFANHASHLDTLLIWAALPPDVRQRVHPVAGADYWGRSALRRRIALKGLNAVLIDRSGEQRDAGSDPLDPLREVLRRAESLILFPEGTRSHAWLPAEFRSGLYWLAHEFPDAELVPVYLENPARAFPKGALLPVPITCSVHFGAALARFADEPKSQFLERARAAVVALAPPEPGSIVSAVPVSGSPAVVASDPRPAVTSASGERAP